MLTKPYTGGVQLFDANAQYVDNSINIAKDLYFSVLQKGILKAIYPEIKYKNYGLVRYEGNISTRSFIKQAIEGTGRSGVAGGSGSSFPTVSFKATNDAVTAKIIGLGFEYSQNELAQSRETAINILRERAMFVDEQIERDTDEAFLVGLPELGIPHGLFNHSGVEVVQASKTITEYVDSDDYNGLKNEIKTIIQKILDVSNQSLRVTEIVLPSSQFLDLQSGDISVQYRDKTFKTKLEEAFGLKITDNLRLRGAGVGGVDRAVFLCLPAGANERIYQMNVTQSRLALPPATTDNFNYRQIQISGIGEGFLLNDKAIVYMDGV